MLRYIFTLTFIFLSIYCFKLFGQTQRPNLLIIYTDEHNFRTLGCYRATLDREQALMWGETVVETPNIDWIANNGALCTSFYAASPVCSPSRASFVSGKYPQHTAVVNNNIPMDGDITTFAEVLRLQGYATGYAGKWHLDGTAKPGWKPKRKFGFADNRYMFNRGHWKQLEDTPEGPAVKAKNKKGEPSYSIEGSDEKNFSTDFLTQKTIDFIQTHKNESFCYMLSLPDPHGPNTVRTPYDKMYENVQFKQARTHSSSIGKPMSERDSFQMRGHDMGRYYGMVKCIDDNVGRILKTLRENQLIDHTVVVFTSDHGDLCGEHDKLNKGNAYEASAKVPFLVYYPSKIKGGKVINQALTGVDFMPTLLNLMDIPVSLKVDGRNAEMLFTRKKAKKWKDLAVIRSTDHKNKWLAAITDQYKLVYQKDQAPILYDLKNAPDELTNFFGDKRYQKVISRFKGELIQYGKSYNDPFVEEIGIK